MEKTISVRIGKEELIEIEDISKLEGRKKSEILRDVIDKGIKDKKLELALKKFQNNEATASKASKIAGIPLTSFLYFLFRCKIIIFLLSMNFFNIFASGAFIFNPS